MLKATWRSLKAHKARMLLSGLAVVLGVAFVVGTFIFTDTLKGTFDQLFSNEVADVVVTQELQAGGDDGRGTVVSVVPQSVLDEVRDMPGVARATGDIQTLGVTLLDKSGEPIGGNGPPQFGFSFPEYPDDPQLSGLTVVEGRAPTAPEEIVVDLNTAEKGGFKVGDTVSVVTQGPRIEAALVGLARYGVSGGLAGATLTLFDRQYAQETFIGEDAWNQVSIVGDEGTTPEGLRDDVAALRGRRLQGEHRAGAPGRGGRAVEHRARIHQHLPAGLRVHRTVRGHLHHPQHLLDACRAAHPGAGPAAGDRCQQAPDHVVRCGGGVPAGLLGGVLGIVLGIGVALGLRQLLGIFGAELPEGNLVLEPRTIVLGMAVGVIVTVVAAWFPARRASQVPPVAAMRDDVALPAKGLRVRAVLGGVLAGLGAVALLVAVLSEDLPRRLTVAGLGAFALLLGVIILAPVFSRGLVGAVGAPVARLGSVGTLAVRNAQRDRRRTAATATAILVGLALVTAIGVLGASTTKSTDALVDEVVTADFIVQPTSFVPFSTEVGDAIEAVPGIALVSRIRQVPAIVDGAETTVTGVEPETIGQVQTLGMEAAALASGGIVVDTETAATAGVAIGDTIEVTWGNGQKDSLDLKQLYEGQAAFSGWAVSLETMEAAGLPAVDSVPVRAVGA